MFEQVELLDEKLPAGPAGPSAFLAWLPVLGGTVVPSSMFPRFAKTSLRLAVGAVMNLIYIYIYILYLIVQGQEFLASVAGTSAEQSDAYTRALLPSSIWIWMLLPECRQCNYIQ